MIIEPNEYLYGTAFKICGQIANHRSLTLGKQILSKMPKQFEKNPILQTSILNMFVQCGDMTSAEKYFSQMEKTSFSYGVMINGKNISSI